MKGIFHNGQQSRDSVRKMYEGMITTVPLATLGFI